MDADACVCGAPAGHTCQANPRDLAPRDAAERYMDLARDAEAGSSAQAMFEHRAQVMATLYVGDGLRDLSLLVATHFVSDTRMVRQPATADELEAARALARQDEGGGPDQDWHDS